MPLSTLRITLVQTELHWHDPNANRKMLDEKLQPLAGTTDLIVLPEMFTTGFTMDSEHAAEIANGASIEWLRSKAQSLNAVVTGSISTRDGDHYYNRLTWMRPDGSSVSYDKRHLFRMAREHQHYSPGSDRLIVELNGWRVCPLVCYDLRFPVWSRNQCSGDQHDYDVLLYVANWPARRRYAWQTLLKARAIENLSYCIGVNRVGTDGEGHHYAGDSVALDFMGQTLLPESEQAFVATATLDRAMLGEYRQRFPAHLDADDFDLHT